MKRKCIRKIRSQRCRIRTADLCTLDLGTFVSFALLSLSHCCLFRTVGIRTGFALVSFALLSFALLSGYLCNGGGGGGGGMTKTVHRGQIQENVSPYRGFSKPKFFTQGELKDEVWYCFVEKFTTAALPALLTVRFDFVVTVFAVKKIDEDTVKCPWFASFEGASREDSSSSFNLGQLAKRTLRQKGWIWRGRSTTNPAQRSTTEGATNFIWSHQQESHSQIDLYVLYCCVLFSGGGGGGGWKG